MNSSIAFVCMVLVIAAAVLIPLGFAFYRDWDYKRQISGKKKMRTLKEGQTIGETEQETNLQGELLRFEAEMRRKENIIYGQHLM